jgi:hypothetical protein
MNKVKSIVVIFLSLAVLASLVVSCSPASGIGNPVSNEQLPAVTKAAQSSSTEELTNLENTYGFKIVAKSLCLDGMNTTLVLQTDLNPQFWQLSESEFSPQGKTYYETSISFLENNELYSSVSSGTREEPVFDPQTQNVSTIQTFVFPQLPLPDSKFTINAKVTLSNLPESYVPPTGVNFMEPGMIEIPMEFVEFATLGECP